MFSVGSRYQRASEKQHAKKTKCVCSEVQTVCELVRAPENEL
jgi:hypothetical protein